MTTAVFVVAYPLKKVSSRKEGWSEWDSSEGLGKNWGYSHCIEENEES